MEDFQKVLSVGTPIYAHDRLREYTGETFYIMGLRSPQGTDTETGKLSMVEGYLSVEPEELSKENEYIDLKNLATRKLQEESQEELGIRIDNINPKSIIWGSENQNLDAIPDPNYRGEWVAEIEDEKVNRRALELDYNSALLRAVDDELSEVESTDYATYSACRNEYQEKTKELPQNTNIIFEADHNVTLDEIPTLWSNNANDEFSTLIAIPKDEYKEALNGDEDLLYCEESARSWQLGRREMELTNHTSIAINNM